MTRLRKHILVALLAPALAGTVEAMPVTFDEPCVIKTIVTRVKTKVASASPIIAWVTVRSGRPLREDAPQCTEETVVMDIFPELDEFDPGATYSLLEFEPEPVRWSRFHWWRWGGGGPRREHEVPHVDVSEPSALFVLGGALLLVLGWRRNT